MTARPHPYLVIVDPSIGRTGAFVCAKNMARALHGLIPSLLVIPTQTQLDAEDLLPFETSKRLGLRLATRALPAALAWLLALIPSGIHLRFVLSKAKATHLVLNDFYLLQGFICRLLGFRGQIISWVRVAPKRAGGPFTPLLWLLIGLSSNKVVAVSSCVKRQIPGFLKPLLVYDCLESVPAYRQQPSRQGRLVYLGNLMPGKGQDHAIDAFAAIADLFPRSILEFHGGTLDVDNSNLWYQQLQDRCKALGLQERIFFKGPYVNPFTPLLGADVSLNFSDSETFSFTVLEALSAGVPVIATNCGGPAELIEDQVTGVLVPVRDRAAMAQAIAKRLRDLDETAAMGVAAARSMAQRFSKEAYRKQLLALIDPCK